MAGPVGPAVGPPVGVDGVPSPGLGASGTGGSPPPGEGILGGIIGGSGGSGGSAINITGVVVGSLPPAPGP